MIADEIERIFWSESRRVLATLIRLLGDFDRAEEAMQEAFRIALEKWPVDGIPKTDGVADLHREVHSHRCDPP